MVLSCTTDSNDEASGDSPQGVLTEIQAPDAFGSNIILEDVKVTVDDAKEVDSPPMATSTRGASISTTADIGSDAASVQSATPVSPVQDRSLPISTEAVPLSTRPPPVSQTGGNIVQEDTFRSARQRRARHRSVVESRASNRLSGFFNFINRREPTPTTTREPAREDSPLFNGPNFEGGSCVSSPIPARPTTPPPPSLPPPSLQELGLSLSAVTSDQCPSHFSSPPTSGAFLLPHYLLLCHSQGLDVLPLVSPPVMQPYALIRRVNFKSVVVMEQRGVLVAIAGRRDGVRVYALEEIKKAIEWRMEAEAKRERDRQRRETMKKMTRNSESISHSRNSNETRKASTSSSFRADPDFPRPNLLRKNSQHKRPGSTPPLSSAPSVPLIPRPATQGTPSKRPQSPIIDLTSDDTPTAELPPPYAGSTDIVSPLLQTRPSYISLLRTARINSFSNVLTQTPMQRPENSRNRDDQKSDWAASSDEEAIDAVASGPSGTHLDERTSATFAASTLSMASPKPGNPHPVPVQVASPSATATPGRRTRPSNLDLSAARSDAVVPPEPSPAPSLLTLRQALFQPPPSPDNPTTNPSQPEDDDDDADGEITLVQALLESRLPELPPIGTLHPQEPILITPSTPRETSPQITRTPTPDGDLQGSTVRRDSTRRQRRWSIMVSSPTADNVLGSQPPASAPATRTTNQISRWPSTGRGSPLRPSTEPVSDPAASVPSETIPQSSRSSRFLPWIINNVLHGRVPEERPPTSASLPELSDVGSRWVSPMTTPVPAPKLEYVKLPGTKGSILIKAVETAKKSFLAILCGEHGEKVELFAGTYRTALGLSRTFILPDSPRSLELQLQGDDLVELFLVFAQNVFGLEPATVRVREIRIGRAERRAARRRARENRLAGRGDIANDAEPEEETNVGVSIGISIPAASNAGSSSLTERPESPALFSQDHPEEGRAATPEPTAASTPGQNEEVLLMTTQMGPYTTFQQLGFAPRFPLASIADEYIIPPTYPSVLETKAQHELENRSEDVPVESQERAQFTPPGLPVPTLSAPSRWFYRDPKNIVHGPWKASLMQAWYKDGLLPPELPVRREEDTVFILLRDLRLRCVDPTQPFRNFSPATRPPPNAGSEQPLLSPISLLMQPRHFGPPALFYSSRGGHSTAIVDARGRSVLKGRFFWTSDNDARFAASGKMGDIKRLEAFDVSERSVLVALRQGGLEVVDLGDALLKPADESRTHLPDFFSPLTAVGRRAPFIWRIGGPLSSAGSTVSAAIITKGKGYSSGKKVGITSAKHLNDVYGMDSEVDHQEAFFLGRNEDDVYLCERNSSSFRVLRLSSST